MAVALTKPQFDSLIFNVNMKKKKNNNDNKKLCV